MDTISLRRVWRFFGTAASFFLFGVGGLFFTFLFFPSLKLFVKNQKKRESIAQNVIRRSFQGFVGVMQGVGAIDVEVDGIEILEKEAGCLVVANHPTLIDYVLLTSLLPRCICVVKEAMWDNPFARGAIRTAGYIPNTDTSEMLTKSSRALDEGNVLLIFPEGTRTVPDKTSDFKRGAAQIAIRTNKDIRIIKITCNPPFLFKGDKWYKVPQIRPKLLIHVGKKINVSEHIKQYKSESVASRKLTDDLRQALSGQCVNEENK